MRRTELADLAAFVAVADTLSFRAAADRLGVTASALSHTIRQVEERHGARLLHRTTRKVSLTDAGERLVERLRPAMDEIAGAVQSLDEQRGQPYGRLAILAVPSAAPGVLTQVWARYLATYPSVQMDVHLDSRPHDLVAEGFDAAIGLYEWASVDMVAVRVSGPSPAVFVAAPSYLARRGAPRRPEDLAGHNCIRLRAADGTFVEWRFQLNGKSQKMSPVGQIVVDGSSLSFQAAADGRGVAFGSERVADPYLRSGQVVRVLEAWAPTFEGLYLYYPHERHVSPALRALIDMMRAAL